MVQVDLGFFLPYLVQIFLQRLDGLGYLFFGTLKAYLLERQRVREILLAKGNIALARHALFHFIRVSVLDYQISTTSPWSGARAS